MLENKKQQNEAEVQVLRQMHLPRMAALSPALPIASVEPCSNASVQVAPNSISRGCGTEPVYMGRPPTHISRYFSSLRNTVGLEIGA